MKNLYSYPIFRIFLIALVIGLVVLIGSYFIPPVYRSKSQILIGIVDPDLNNYQLSDVIQREAQTIKSYSQSRDFLVLVLNDAHVSYAEKDLEDGWIKKFKIETPANSAVIKITTFDNAANQAQILNQSAINVLKKQIESISSLKENTNISFKVIEAPSVYLQPVSPQPLLYALVVFLAVLFLGSLFFIY